MRVDDVSPRDENTTLRLNRDYQSVAGKALCCALSADKKRAYLGGHSGVWRSDDGGATWWHPEWPQPPAGSIPVPGALQATNVYDLLISPASNDLVLAATGRDSKRPSLAGIYRSADGGQNWALVHQFNRIVGSQTETSNLVGCLAVAPDDPNLMFAAGGFGVARSLDGGANWTDSFPSLPLNDRVWHVVVGRQEENQRRVYGVGSHVWYSLDAGLNWLEDPQAISLGAPADGAGESSRSMAVHPGNPAIVYIVVGPGQQIWRGEYPPITSAGPGLWTQIPPPPADYGGTTASGAGFVLADVAAGRLFLFVSDRRTVHVAAGEPAATSDWTRVEDSRCHLDPHGLSISPDFNRHVPPNKPPRRFGRILLVNDGGANYSTNGANTWSNGRGLSTLGLVNVAINVVRGKPPAICMGMGDNSGFSSPDGGANWETQDYIGGDNDCCFADPLQPARMFVFAPRSGAGNIFVYTGSGGNPPDASFGTSQRKAIPYPPPLADPDVTDKARGSNIVSSFVLVGYRPLVLTGRGESPRPDGDFITIRFTTREALLLRTTRVSQITSSDDWVTSATQESPSVKVFQQGPPLPSPHACVVQASGGHASPVYYVSDSQVGNFPGQMRLWKWKAGMAAWQKIVPGPPAVDSTRPGTELPGSARRFFVDPYRPNLIYVLDSNRICRSDDGGNSWVIDTPLAQALTENGAFPFDVPNDGNPLQALIREMLFDPERPDCRFAIGPAGVFHTVDGVNWNPLVRSIALAMRPMGAVYDNISCDRALYVATSNRGLLRITELPPDWTFPIGSLQATEGVIVLLRVHDKGTKFGPPHDQIDAEVIVQLDTQPEKAFGLQLRQDANERVARGMLDLLRDAFGRSRRVRLEFVRVGCRTGRIVRVIEQ